MTDIDAVLWEEILNSIRIIRDDLTKIRGDIKDNSSQGMTHQAKIERLEIQVDKLETIVSQFKDSSKDNDLEIAIKEGRREGTKATIKYLVWLSLGVGALIIAAIQIH